MGDAGVTGRVMQIYVTALWGSVLGCRFDVGVEVARGWCGICRGRDM